MQAGSGSPYLKNGTQPQHEVSGVIGLSGKAQGTVVLGLSREAALGAAEVLLQERPPEINGDVTDAIGELVNIIAGSAKAKLEHLELSVSLPTVITGKCHCVEFPTESHADLHSLHVSLGRYHRGGRALRDPRRRSY